MKDYKKLLSFADLIEVPVIRKRLTSNAGEFNFSESGAWITLCTSLKKEELTLTLLHELGHALDWINKGRKSDSFPHLSKRLKDFTKLDRFHMWDNERVAVTNMDRIAEMLNLSIPTWKIETEQQFDLWVANEFYRTGKYPKKRDCRTKWKEISQQAEKVFKNE